MSTLVPPPRFSAVRDGHSLRSSISRSEYAAIVSSSRRSGAPRSQKKELPGRTLAIDTSRASSRRPPASRRGGHRRQSLPADDVSLRDSKVYGAGISQPRAADRLYSRQLLGQNAPADERLRPVARAATTETVVIDYIGPNVAKGITIGHLRAKIIGDSIFARCIEWPGHESFAATTSAIGPRVRHAIETLIRRGAAVRRATDRATSSARLPRERARGSTAIAAFADRARRRSSCCISPATAETLAPLERTLIERLRRDFSPSTPRLGALTLRTEEVGGDSRTTRAARRSSPELTRKGLAVESEGASASSPGSRGARARTVNPHHHPQARVGYGLRHDGYKFLAALRPRRVRMRLLVFFLVVVRPQKSEPTSTSIGQRAPNHHEHPQSHAPRYHGHRRCRASRLGPNDSVPPRARRRSAQAGTAPRTVAQDAATGESVSLAIRSS